MNDEYQRYNPGSETKFKNTVLRSSLCDYIDANILVKETMKTTGEGADAAAQRANERCISEINNAKVDNAKILML